MKKILLLTAFSCVAGITLNAQTPVIINGSLDTWSAVSNSNPLLPALEKPNNWCGSDSVLNYVVGPVFAIQGIDFDFNKQLFKETTTTHEGVAAAKLMSKNFGDSLKTLPVLLTNARQNVNLSAMGGGALDLMTIFKFKNGTDMLLKKVDSVVAYVSTPSTNVEDAAAFVMAYKQVTSDSMTVIGEGAVNIPANSGGYVKIVIPVTYTGEQATNMMVVGFSSAGQAPSTGYTLNNTLYVDKVEVFASEPTSVKGAVKSNLGFNVYPNPATNVVNFENRGKEQKTILLIQNSVGQIMHQATMNDITTVDVSRYATGTYFYEIYKADGSARQVGKFIK